MAKVNRFFFIQYENIITPQSKTILFYFKIPYLSSSFKIARDKR